MSLSKISEAERKISKGDDVREEMALVVGPNANWQEYLVPAPMCIALLGQLMLVSTAADFTLEKKPPIGGFKHIKWPNSFRASLVQVSNAGAVAFNEAHKNMDQIRLYTAKVPEHLKRAVTILMTGTVDEIRDMLPVPMTSIKETATNCLQLAESVEAKFAFVMELTAELLEACVSAKTGYEQKLKESEIALKIAEENRKSAEDSAEMAKRRYEQLEKAVKRAEDEYYKSIRDVPGGMSMVMMKAVDAMSARFTNILTFRIGRQKERKEKPSTGNAKEVASTELDEYEEMFYNFAAFINSKVENLTSELLEKNELHAKALQKTDIVFYCKKCFMNYKSEAQTKHRQHPVKTKVISLCDRGIKICQDLHILSNQFKYDQREIQELETELLQLQQDAVIFLNESKVVFNANPSDSMPPQRAKARAEYPPSENVLQSAIQNARYKIEATTAHLDHSRHQFDKASDKKADASQKLAHVMSEIAKLDMDKIEFETIKKTLVQGIKAMGELREKWQKLVQFFQMMSNIIKCGMNTSLSDFIKYTEKASMEKEASGFAEYSISSLRKDMIYQQVVEACKIAHLVHMISGTYVEVSDAHIMGPISGLGKLLGLDPEKDKQEIQRLRMELLDGCENAQFQIKLLVEKRRNEFDQRIASRIQKVRGELEAALPPPTPKEQENAKQIQDSIKANLTTIESPDAPNEINVDDFI